MKKSFNFILKPKTTLLHHTKKRPQSSHYSKRSYSCNESFRSNIDSRGSRNQKYVKERLFLSSNGMIFKNIDYTDKCGKD